MGIKNLILYAFLFKFTNGGCDNKISSYTYGYFDTIESKITSGTDHVTSIDMTISTKSGNSYIMSLIVNSI